jgi:hypothetical protein
MAHPVYQYQPLATETSIRILVLHPADRFAAQLEVSFKHLDRHAPYDLDISGHYEAVSYCWGESSFSHSVSFSSPTSQLPITANVDSMLRHLRKPHKAKHLWVDALCINQTNAEEKSSQVRSMDGIFQEATKVHVWLGPDASCGVEKVFAYFKKLVTKHEYQESGVPSVLLNHFITTDPTFREALEQLLSNPWFRRRWNLQEITLGHDITTHCGTQKIAWVWFTKAIYLLKQWTEKTASRSWETSNNTSSVLDPFYDRISSSLDPIYDKISSVYNTTSTSINGKRKLSNLLLHHASAECVDHQDRIYALFGLMEVVDRQARLAALLPKVDYTRDFIETYTEVASAFITAQPYEFWQQLVSLKPLSLNQPDAPSWVPDWTRPRVIVPKYDIIPLTGKEHLVSQQGRQALRLQGWRYDGYIRIMWNSDPTMQATLDDIVCTIKADLERPDARPRERARSPEQDHDHLRSQLVRLMAFITLQNRVDSRDVGEYFDDCTFHELVGYCADEIQEDSYSTNEMANDILKQHKIFRVISTALAESRHYDIDPRGMIGITDGDIHTDDLIFRCSGRATQSHRDSGHLPLGLVIRGSSLKGEAGARSNMLCRLIGFCFFLGEEEECVPKEPWITWNTKGDFYTHCQEAPTYITLV